VPQIFFDESNPFPVEDDHRPFMEKGIWKFAIFLKREYKIILSCTGVAVLHLITTPFPSVWHQPSDNAQALNWPTIHNLASTIRLFVAEYLKLQV
jgi:glutaminyl-peptide cyclotransferase